MKNQKLAIITVGVSASGKSTFAKSLIDSSDQYVEINRDGIRRSLFKVGGWSDYVFSEENEKAVTNEQYRLFRKAIEENKNVVITDMNLRMKYVQSLIKFFSMNGYTPKIKFCQISVLETLRRQSNRTVTARSEEIVRQHKLFERTKHTINSRYHQYVIGE